MKQVTCPVALHPFGEPRRITCFEHPLAGLQMVKGGLLVNESPAAGAARELFGKSGLETTAAIPLGQSADIADAEIWHFALCRIKPPVRDHWQHFCKDDGGHLFKFWWMPMDAPPAEGFHQKFLSALDWIRKTI